MLPFIEYQFRYEKYMMISMRNTGYLRLFRQNNMRNTLLKSISHIICC